MPDASLSYNFKAQNPEQYCTITNYFRKQWLDPKLAQFSLNNDNFLEKNFFSYSLYHLTSILQVK
ncbi:pikD; phosphatidylinositol 4-kinase; K00888 phosphatidylinositol 4-kinase ['Nostoc azollae' 0708]|jgi:hypothetical protein|uniref:PikD phosphatidylinositol 4-kinase K00888 phosphatidylinositol 4-kinase n=1 Tax=Nostoc azollae (strain 0708) TaxID=551115 RepID=D7DX17_NOSA0|nr:pikD; phosphatidylinositol 4-kinase; K00888 phosphatidylinositol 4-kinase ['Nostoc azollae' 0708]